MEAKMKNKNLSYGILIGILTAIVIVTSSCTTKPSIEEAKELLSQQLLTQTGVVGVGIGECEAEPCIKVLLEKELENLPNLKDKIPSQSRGFKVVTEVTGTICTEEVKVCPDGSEVGRVPPNCEFAPCLSSNNIEVCTDEAKLCPDGTEVSRNPRLNCEFDPCPITK